MVFGLFESKSEKLTKKYFKISRELFAASRRVLNNPNSEWWKKYYCETMRHLKEIGEDIQREMGREYMINLEKMIELAESDLKIDIKKNSNTPQSGGSKNTKNR